MLVQYVAIAPASGGRLFFTEKANLRQALLLGAREDVRRIAFVGKTKRGKGGIALLPDDGTVTGHKMIWLGEEDLEYHAHVAPHEARQGLRRAADGESVFIGERNRGIVILLGGPFLEVWGAGLDSAA